MVQQLVSYGEPINIDGDINGISWDFIGFHAILSGFVSGISCSKRTGRSMGISLEMGRRTIGLSHKWDLPPIGMIDLYLSICLSVCLSVYLPTYLPIYIYTYDICIYAVTYTYAYYGT